ncbi:hypothetical protein SKAU_G00043770 [Synaphobranchus kaupii]|uniref:Uncharacterized protein n=1 Tax=Synaphobranchus kaupii TaxID=118154 RepID=A0A9Q1G2K9_SYNKA|nr:hypothetical protein SKAU_G00043770 [Synaphobranchus kaupii]
MLKALGPFQFCVSREGRTTPQSYIPAKFGSCGDVLVETCIAPLSPKSLRRGAASGLPPGPAPLANADCGLESDRGCRDRDSKPQTQAVAFRIPCDEIRIDAMSTEAISIATLRPLDLAVKHILSVLSPVKSTYSNKYSRNLIWL